MSYFTRSCLLIIIIIIFLKKYNFINKIPRKTNLIYNICSTAFRTIIIIIIYNNCYKIFFKYEPEAESLGYLQNKRKILKIDYLISN